MVLREIPTLVDGYSLGDMKRPTIEDDDPEQKHEDEIDNAKPLISLDLCSVPQAYGIVAFKLLNNIGFGINAASVLVYLFAFYLLRRSNASSKMRTVFKSISITVAIVIVGWFTTFLINSLSFLITNSDYVRMVINMYAGITVNIGTAANVFVYYAINTEYRDVIKRMLGFRFYKARVIEVSTMNGLGSSRRKTTIPTAHG
ncbi:hypothetical protein ANCCEY_04588 [Ancylostoma ceylanicum]|uniref:G-protein coupled receptors family 1 profile domain-containing protein n=1 Tax=Ancylostoma ceylanicum TaxID=53326 RepID=A0A0D6M1X8_9BILA|nr:hypothetical protein ANCCEY_04588 [Ancylostoma ceylanicum]